MSGPQRVQAKDTTRARPQAPTAGTRRRFGVIPRTLRWRLAISVAVLIAVSFVITFVAVYRGTGSSLSHQIDTEIRGDAGALAHVLASTHAHSPAATRAAAQRYVRDQPYTGTSPLLFALVAGAPPATNQPELFNARAPADAGESSAEQGRENGAGAALEHARLGYSKHELPDVGLLRLLTQKVAVAGGPTVTIGVGESLAAVHSAQDGVARAFVLAGVLVLVCALLAAYLIGTRFSAPLRRMASVAARVDAGDLRPRIHEARDPPEEVHVLAESFNHMLDRLTEAFAAQRAFVADASHELRTPLTVIHGQLELLAAEVHPDRAEVRRVSALVQAEVARISRLVDDLLLLAKSERAELLRPQVLDLGTYVRELWENTLVTAQRGFELGEIPAGTLRADPDRLTQAMRNLLANAIEHTSTPNGLVRLSVIEAAAGAEPGAGAGARNLRFVVEDDGPGIPPAQREQIFARFHRTDTGRGRQTGGAGLGLAIVRAIAHAHGGSVVAGSSAEGGARVELTVPGFTPSGAPDAAGAGAAPLATGDAAPEDSAHASATCSLAERERVRSLR